MVLYLHYGWFYEAVISTSYILTALSLYEDGVAISKRVLDNLLKLNDKKRLAVLF